MGKFVNGVMPTRQEKKDFFENIDDEKSYWFREIGNGNWEKGHWGVVELLKSNKSVQGNDYINVARVELDGSFNNLIEFDFEKLPESIKEKVKEYKEKNIKYNKKQS